MAPLSLYTEGLTAKLVVPANRKVFFVGDIHGNYNALDAGLQQVKFNSTNDILVCTGDLIDRGDDSVKCLSLINQPWFFPVLGNHDLYAFSTISNGARNFFDVWQKNGGGWWFRQTEEQKRTASILLDQLFFNETPLLLEVQHEGHGNYAVTHADLPESTNIDELRGHLKAVEYKRPSEWEEAIKHNSHLINSRWLSGALYRRLKNVVPEERQQYVPTALKDLSFDAERIYVRGVDVAIQGHTPIAGLPLRAGNRIMMDTGGWQEEDPLQILSSLELNKNG